MNFRQVVGVQVEQNRCKDRALRKAVILRSPGTGVIAHVHPETSISKQQTHQSGEPIWHAFTQFVKTVSYVAVKSRKRAPVFRFCWNPFTIKVVRAAVTTDDTDTCLWFGSGVPGAECMKVDV